MATKVYGWPPVGAVGAEWDYVSPISESFSALTGRRYASASKPERRVAQVVASAQSSDRMGAGYMVMLKRLLEGGTNLIQLTSYPLNRFLDTDRQNAFRQSIRLLWEAGEPDLDWIFSGVDGLWYDGTVIIATVTTSGGFPAVQVTDGPPDTLIARPGEFITVFENAEDTVGSTAQVLAPARTNGDGACKIRLFTAVAYGGRINIGVKDKAVFRAVGELPRALQPVRGDWTYGWQFEEVFSAEVGGFTLDNAWWEET